MSVTIVAAQTSDPGAPQVGVTVAGLSAASSSPVTVTTSWDGGVSWQPVRGGAVSAIGSAFIRDYLPALGIPVVYQATWSYLRQNLAANPSVEVDASGWAGWAGVGGTATFAQSSAAHYSGAYAFAGTWTAAPSSGGGIIYDTGTTLAPSSVYTFSMYVYCTVAVTVSPQVQWYAGSTPTGGAAGATVSVPASTWTRVSMTGTSAAGDNHAQFRVYVSGAGITSSTAMYGDALLIEPGSDLYPYYEGAPSSWTGSVTSAPVTVTSATAWIQDPLAPKSAVPLYADMAPGHILLTLGSLAAATWAQHVDLAVPIGSDLAAASISVRQKVSALPLVLTYDIASEAGALRNLLLTSGQLVVRGLSSTAQLDPVAHVVTGDASEARIGPGFVAQWTLTVRQVRPVTLRVVIPWWTYDDVKALVQSQLGSTVTYAGVAAAQPAGKTYTDWVASPGVV